MEEGFQWFGTDEGVLGRTLNVGFFRDAPEFPQTPSVCTSLGASRSDPATDITGLFRDHQLSDLIGFVYSRMDQKSAAADLHGKLRYLADQVQSADPLTICIFLDGENAWEYYPGNGREFLREFYRRIGSDQDFRALTASEAIAAAKNTPVNRRDFPGILDQREFRCVDRQREKTSPRGNCCGTRGRCMRAASKPSKQNRRRCADRNRASAGLESLLVAEGSDWCWWYGPEHSTANDAEFDALFRKHLTGIYLALGQPAPPDLAKPIKRKPEHALAGGTDRIPKDAASTAATPLTSSGSAPGLYSPERRGGAMHGRIFYLRELRYGFEEDRLQHSCRYFSRYSAERWTIPEFRITIGGAEEVRSW